MEKTRLDTPLVKYSLFIPLLFLIAGIITSVYYHKTPSPTELLTSIIFYILFILIFLFYARNLREIYFDDTTIYIKSFFRKKLKKINYANVIELKERFKSIPTFGSKTFLLKYKVDADVITIKFFAVKDNKFSQFQKRIS